MTTFRDLAKPFPDKYVSKNPSGYGTYVPHHIVNQRLIAVLGVAPDFELVRVIRGDVPEQPADKDKPAKPALTNAIVGVVARLTVHPDDRVFGAPTIAEEAGDCEAPQNWPHDGARMKDAMSDAYKRCAMRLGCGLHLWSGDDYFLYDYLTSGAAQTEGRGDGPSGMAATGGGGAPNPSAEVGAGTSNPETEPAPETSDQTTLAHGEGVNGSDSETAGEGGGETPSSPATPTWRERAIEQYGSYVNVLKEAKQRYGPHITKLIDLSEEQFESLVTGAPK